MALYMLKNFTLRHEIFLLMAIKLTLLYGLWALCFSHPIDQHLQPTDVANHVFHTASTLKQNSRNL